MLTCFIEHGVSLEAHVQNCMVVFENGWPRHLYVRDLEGGSISRDVPTPIPPDSPALYDDAAAWQRLQYYFFVNHLGHLVSTLAECVDVDEHLLWRVVRKSIETAPLLHDSERGRRVREALLDGPMLPAKANLTGRFLDVGERAIYVSIPNPIWSAEYA